MNDDAGGADTFKILFDLLHFHYFPHLAWSQLTLNLDKSKFFAQTIEILGHTKDAQGIHFSANKIVVFHDYFTPTNKEELLRFLHMLPFLRTFIPRQTDQSMIMCWAIIESITEVNCNGRKQKIKKYMDFHWEQKQQEAFNAVKKVLLTTCISDGNNELQYHLVTDASRIGAEEVLFQLQNTLAGMWALEETRNHKRIIMFLLFQFLLAKTWYHTTEWEALAVLKCLKETQWLIKESRYPVKLYTDHQALKKILWKDDSHECIARWQLRLEKYDVEIKHISRKKLIIADELSRIHGSLAYLNTHWDEEFSLPAFTVEMKNSSEESVKDDWERKWVKWLKNDWYTVIVEFKILEMVLMTDSLVKLIMRMIKAQVNWYKLMKKENKRHLAYRERSGQLSKCLHLKEISDALWQLHDIHRHFAEQITSQKVIEKIYWSIWSKNIYQYCRSCINCQMLGLLRFIKDLLPILQLQLLDLLSIDYIESFISIAQSRTQYIIIAVNYFSCFIFAKAVPTVCSVNSLEFLMQFITDIFRWPQAIYLDNRSHFMKEIFVETLKKQEVQHLNTSVTHPSSVELAEVYVQLTLRQLRANLQESEEAIFN